jgi:hypothetical protein
MVQTEKGVPGNKDKSATPSNIHYGMVVELYTHSKENDKKDK